ncbi:L,D-transpeptidase [Jiella endophytica]|uniref:L,D-transpeptidase n=1 Tax=Jiella endophytica TaxID=2558362 RepID=A0A4Y8RQ00_9HYPH|nr:L,D-transpeptidase [Jiella endophytica]TFF25426.1 L,D-transpeptidase [Jiella endophytica]
MTIKTSLAIGTAIASLMLAGCATGPQRASLQPADTQVAAYAGQDGLMNGGLAATGEIGYGAVTDDGFALPAIPTAKIDPQFLRQEVSYPEGSQYEPGTVVVDTSNRFLYVVEPSGMAMRYGIGVGRSGFSWAGDAEIHDKQHWPKWFPPSEMIDRKPELEPYREGMQPGLTNPLGARALYLYQNGKDTLFRLHGTPEWWTIGTAASSGCIRLMNQDIIDLYNRVPMGAKVVVKQGNERLAKR